MTNLCLLRHHIGRRVSMFRVIKHTTISVQVCLYFYNKLYRGNRVTKVDAGSFNAFSSPNLPPLATAEVDIRSKPVMYSNGPVFMWVMMDKTSSFVSCVFSTVNWDTVWRANTTAKFQVSTELNRNVGLLRLFPGITAATVSVIEILSISVFVTGSHSLKYSIALVVQRVD